MGRLGFSVFCGGRLARVGWRLAALFVTGAVAAMFAVAGCARMRPPSRPPDYVREMTITAYCSCGDCCGWERNWLGRPVEKKTGKPKRVGQTASGRIAARGTVAAARDVPFGTIVYIEGYGYGRVEDRGGAIRGDRLDVWFKTHRQALQWGRKKIRVEFWLPEKQRKR